MNKNMAEIAVARDLGYVLGTETVKEFSSGRAFPHSMKRVCDRDSKLWQYLIEKVAELETLREIKRG